MVQKKDRTTSNARYWEIMNRVSDLLLLNILFIMTSLPLFTIGASAKAILLTLNTRTYGVKELFSVYWKQFTQRFVDSVLLTFVVVLIGGTNILNLYTLGRLSGSFRYLLLGLSLFVGWNLITFWIICTYHLGTSPLGFRSSLKACFNLIMHEAIHLVLLPLPLVVMGLILVLGLLLLKGLFLIVMLCGVSLPAYLTLKLMKRTRCKELV